MIARTHLVAIYCYRAYLRLQSRASCLATALMLMLLLLLSLLLLFRLLFWLMLMFVMFLFVSDHI